MKKVLLLGYYGFDNSGDDAILKAIVKGIKNFNEDYEITAFSKNPDKTKREYNINSVDRFSFFEVLNAMKNTDLFVFGGGSLLQDKTSSRSLFYYLGMIRLAKFFNKKVFVFANGIGPINKNYNRNSTKKILEKVDYITLRDKSSYDFIKELGVKNKNVEITADPVFLLESSGESQADRILKEQNIKLGKNVIGISVRKWNESLNLNREVAKFCDKFVNEDIDFLIIPMHYPKDVEYSKSIKNLSKNERIHVLDTKYEVEDIISLIKKCEIMIAMRLHSLIYSAKAKVPMISLVYDPKVSGLSKELEISEIIGVEDLSAEVLFEKYNDLILSFESRKDSIISANEKQEELSKKTLEYLEDCLKKI